MNRRLCSFRVWQTRSQVHNTPRKGGLPCTASQQFSVNRTTRASTTWIKDGEQRDIECPRETQKMYRIIRTLLCWKRLLAFVDTFCSLILFFLSIMFEPRLTTADTQEAREDDAGSSHKLRHHAQEHHLAGTQKSNRAMTANRRIRRFLLFPLYFSSVAIFKEH